MQPLLCGDDPLTLQDIALELAMLPARTAMRALDLELPPWVFPLHQVALVGLSLLLLAGPPALVWAVAPRRRA